MSDNQKPARHGARWENREDEYLWKHYPGGMLLSEFAEQFNRTPNAIRGHVAKLGIHRRTLEHDDPFQEVGRHRRPWEAWEEEYLRKNYPHLGARPCAARLQRTVCSIWQRANARGIYRPMARLRKYDQSADRVLVEFMRALAEKLGLGVATILYRLKRLHDTGRIEKRTDE